MKTEEEIKKELEIYQHVYWDSGNLMLNDIGQGYMLALQWVLESEVKE